MNITHLGIIHIHPSIKDDPEALEMFREAMLNQEGGDKRSEEARTANNNVMGGAASQGNSKGYTLSRLKRESPDLFKAVCDGEMTANA